MELICAKCNEKLEKRKTVFQYMKNEFSEELLRCPKCGQVFLDEELVKGRMLQVETELEDK